MTFTFRPAKRENAPVLIGLAGGTGSGKTYSALRLARGPDGATRYVCPLGCGADFEFMSERELHLLTDHGRDEAA